MTSTPPDPAFWTGLFDFSFTRFITRKFIRVIYMVFVAAIGLIGLLLFIISLTRGGAGVFARAYRSPLLTLFYIIGARLTLEVIA